MKTVALFFVFLSAICGETVCFAVQKPLTTVVDSSTAAGTGANGETTDCYSKQQAMQQQIGICKDHQTLTSCLDQFYLNFKKKFPKCAEEAAAACMDACVKGMTYSYCSKYCK